MKKFTAPTAPHDWSGTMKQLCGLYAQTFFTFRTILVQLITSLITMPSVISSQLTKWGCSAFCIYHFPYKITPHPSTPDASLFPKTWISKTVVVSFKKVTSKFWSGNFYKIGLIMLHVSTCGDMEKCHRPTRINVLLCGEHYVFSHPWSKQCPAKQGHIPYFPTDNAHPKLFYIPFEVQITRT